MIQHPTPYRCHLFICTNTRQDGRTSCGDGGTDDFRAALKEAIAVRGWKGVVRVSACGCLGVCEQGPNLMIYPQGIWCSAVAADDLPAILQTVEELLEVRR